MAVNQDPLQITPYTSTVPLVQIPPDAIEGQSRPAPPLQGEFGKRGTGALALGDALLKGFMAGHQAKEQKKQAQAQATINAADAASNAAYEEYQRALTAANGNQNDPKAQAAYQTYQQTFDAGKQAKAQFVIPEKTTKSQSGQQKKGEKGEKKTGWSNFKDFFEANPHIVPQIALLGMQPKPPGPAPETTQTVQIQEQNRLAMETSRLANEKAQRTAENEKIYQNGFARYAHLSPDEVQALPPEVKQGYDQWQNSRAALTPMKFSGAPQVYKLPNGKLARLYKEEQELYYPDAEPYVASAELKPGTEAYFQTRYATENGLDPQAIPSATSQYLHEYWKWQQQYGPTTVSSSTTDISGNRTTTTSKSAPPPPKPPSGVAPVQEPGVQPPPQASPKTAGGIGKPPVVKAAAKGQATQGISRPPQTSKTAKGGITAPPGSKDTWQREQVTRQATEKQQAGYRKAEAGYTKALQAADKAYDAAVKGGMDPAEAQKAKDRAYARAQLDLEDEKASVAAAYNAAVKSLGGTPGAEKGAGLPPGWN